MWQAAIGAGANIVGGVMQMIAAKRAAEAMRQQFLQELERQQGYRNQSFNAFNESVPQRGVETARTEIGKGKDRRNEMYAQYQDTSYSADPRNKPTARDKATYKLLGNNRAQLGGYSDWALNQMVHNIRTQDKLNKYANFAEGDASVFPYRMGDAQHSQDTLSAIGGLVSSIGGSAPQWSNMFGGQGQQATSNYGLNGMGFSIPLNHGVDYTPASGLDGNNELYA